MQEIELKWNDVLNKTFSTDFGQIEKTAAVIKEKKKISQKMGKVKAEKGSSKWLGIKMKSKGLQKLRWYCQMCQKQCRDQNGFKCHISSESHQR